MNSWLFKIFFWFSILVVLILAVLPNSRIPSVFIFWDKAQHFLAFCFLSGLGLRAYRSSWIFIFLGLILWGGTIEIIQWFLPWRDASVADFFADALGVISLFLAIRYYLKNSKDYDVLE